MDEFEWWRTPDIPLTKTIIVNGQTQEYKTLIRYAVGGTSLLDTQVSTSDRQVYSICNRADGCKKLKSICK
eukprot:4456633-Prymnesium_polylepis.1